MRSVLNGDAHALPFVKLDMLWGTYIYLSIHQIRQNAITVALQRDMCRP